MPAQLHPTDEEVATLRRLIETDCLQQGLVAEAMGWPKSRVERLVKRLGLRTQRTGPRSGPGHTNWKGGRIIDKDGYALLWTPGHPNARRHTHYVFEHRLVMEEVIGRALEPGEVVHHRNANRLDNRPENLRLFARNADHLRHELTGRVPNWTPEGKAKLLRLAEAKRRPRPLPDAPQKPSARRH